MAAGTQPARVWPRRWCRGRGGAVGSPSRTSPRSQPNSSRRNVSIASLIVAFAAPAGSACARPIAASIVPTWAWSRARVAARSGMVVVARATSVLLIVPPRILVTHARSVQSW